MKNQEQSPPILRQKPLEIEKRLVPLIKIVVDSHGKGLTTNPRIIGLPTHYKDLEEKKNKQGEKKRRVRQRASPRLMICVSNWRICMERIDSIVSPTNPISLPLPRLSGGEITSHEQDVKWRKGNIDVTPKAQLKHVF
jgi:hypothetical protein